MTLKDSSIIWLVFAAKIWNVKLDKVWEEMKNYELPWKHLGIKQCLINFCLALLLLCMSNFDVYSDIIVAHDYIAGATYFYVLTSANYSNLIEMNCTVNYDTVYLKKFYGAYGVDCTTKDPMFGYISLGIVFAPGSHDYSCRVKAK